MKLVLTTILNTINLPISFYYEIGFFILDKLPVSNLKDSTKIQYLYAQKRFET